GTARVRSCLFARCATRREGCDMITVPAGVRVLVATRPVDFRKGADGLAALVREALGADPFSGMIFVFRAKRADRIKILAWDGSGLTLFWKRLEHGAFKWPPISDGMMRLTASQLAALVDGMDWSRLHARDVARPTATSSALPRFESSVHGLITTARESASVPRVSDPEPQLPA